MMDRDDIESYEYEQNDGMLFIDITGPDGKEYNFWWDENDRPQVERNGRGRYTWQYQGLPFLNLGRRLNDLYQR
jgi:hypothetical protein